MASRSTPESRRSPGRITIRELHDERDPAVADAYRLLTGAFHRNERVDRREWIASLREKKGRLLSDLAWHLFVAERDGAVIGFSSGTYVGSVNVGVIGYLAIESNIRAAGLGTRLRNRLRTAFAADAKRIVGRPLQATVGEVSVDNPWLRRLASRRGVLLLDFDYYQPQLRADDEPSKLVFYYEAFGTPRRRIPTSELRQLLFAIWRRVYRISRPLDRPAFRAILRSLEGRRTIGALSLSPKRPAG